MQLVDTLKHVSEESAVRYAQVEMLTKLIHDIMDDKDPKWRTSNEADVARIRYRLASIVNAPHFAHQEANGEGIEGVSQ